MIFQGKFITVCAECVNRDSLYWLVSNTAAGRGQTRPPCRKMEPLCVNPISGDMIWPALESKNTGECPDFESKRKEQHEA